MALREDAQMTLYSERPNCDFTHKHLLHPHTNTFKMLLDLNVVTSSFSFTLQNTLFLFYVVYFGSILSQESSIISH